MISTATFSEMAVRKFKPVTPGQRNKVISAFDDITCTVPEKSLLAPIRKSGGRNNQGKMTMRYIGGGHKRKYRVIDFCRDKADIPAKIAAIEYDPNRTARIALSNRSLRTGSIPPLTLTSAWLGCNIVKTYFSFPTIARTMICGSPYKTIKTQIGKT